MNEVIGMPGQGRQFTRRVGLYNAGASALTLRKGQAVCYDRTRVTTNTYETATDPWTGRDWRVVPPSITNNDAFAGVLAQKVTVPAGSEVPVEIYEPGSVCDIAIAGTAALTINSSRLSFLADGPSGYTGLFQREGLPGRGAALVLQTMALGTASAGVAASAVPKPIVAAYAAVYTYSTGRITINGVEAKAAVGDTVVVLSGQQDASTHAAVTRAATTVASVGTNYITLTAAATIFAGFDGNGHVSLCIYRGEPTVLAYLETGEESGGIQYNGSGITQALAYTQVPCGLVYFDPSATLGADLTITLADPVAGQRQWGIILDAAAGANDILIAGATAIGAPLAAGTAFSSGDLDAANDRYFFRAVGGRWMLSGAYIA